MPAEHSIPEDKSRRTLIIFVAAFAAAFIAAFFYLLLRNTAAPSAPPTLAGAIRPGSAEWEKYGKLIALDAPEADEAKRALGDTVMTLHTTARNFTGRTITGLEIRAAVVDHDGKPVKGTDGRGDPRASVRTRAEQDDESVRDTRRIYGQR